MYRLTVDGKTYGEVDTLTDVKRGLRAGIRNRREAGHFEGMDGYDRERALDEQVDALTEEGIAAAPVSFGPLPVSGGGMALITYVPGPARPPDRWEPPSTIMRKVEG